MKKIKLSEAQVRKAVNNWLFEWIPTNDDKRAGTLGDKNDSRDSRDQINNPQPIIALDQMANPATVDLPPIEDPEWTPETSDEIARAAFQISKQIPQSEIKEFYTDLLSLSDKAIEKGNNPDLNDWASENDDIVNPIKVSIAKAGENMEESKILKRWINLLIEGNDEDEETASEKDLEAFYKEQEQEAEELWGENGTEYTDPEYSYQDLIDTGVLPSIVTPTGMMKWINKNINPHVIIWEVARPLSMQLSQFIRSDAGLALFYSGLMASDNFTDENVAVLKGCWQLYQGIKQVLEKNKQRVPAKLLKDMVSSNKYIQQLVMQYADEMVTVKDEDGNLGDWTISDLWDDYLDFKAENKRVIQDSSLYSEIMSIVVVDPILDRWEKEFGNRKLSRKDKDLVSWEEAGKWLQEEVLDRWYGGTERFPKPRAVSRRGGDIDKALRQRGEYAYDEQGNPIDIWKK